METRLEWHTQPIKLSNEHSVALQYWMIVQVGGLFFFLYAKVKIASFSFFEVTSLSLACHISAHLGQVSGHVRRRRHAILDLGVGDGAVLLSQVQPQLTLVAEVQVAFLTLEEERERG